MRVRRGGKLHIHLPFCPTSKGYASDRTAASTLAVSGLQPHLLLLFSNALLPCMPPPSTSSSASPSSQRHPPCLLRTFLLENLLLSWGFGGKSELIQLPQLTLAPTGSWPFFPQRSEGLLGSDLPTPHLTPWLPPADLSPPCQPLSLLPRNCQ